MASVKCQEEGAPGKRRKVHTEVDPFASPPMSPRRHDQDGETEQEDTDPEADEEEEAAKPLKPKREPTEKGEEIVCVSSTAREGNSFEGRGRAGEVQGLLHAEVHGRPVFGGVDVAVSGVGVFSCPVRKSKMWFFFVHLGDCV